MFLDFASWWYTLGWQHFGQGILRHIKRTYLSFSVAILLRTLFEPWRRIISTDTDTLNNRMRSIVDNMVSRVVGFMVRILALIAAIIIITATAVGGAIVYVLWPILPVMVFGLIIWGIIK